MHGWQANKKRTCTQPVVGRAMPETEIPPAMRVDFYCYCTINGTLTGAFETYISDFVSDVCLKGRNISSFEN